MHLLIKREPFEWDVYFLYSHVIDLYEELWDIIEDGCSIPINEDGSALKWKSMIEEQRKPYKKHHKTQSIMVNTLLFLEDIETIYKFNLLYIWGKSTSKGSQDKSSDPTTWAIQNEGWWEYWNHVFMVSNTCLWSASAKQKLHCSKSCKYNFEESFCQMDTQCDSYPGS